MAEPIRAPEPEVVLTPVPARKNKADEQFKPAAGDLYRALRRRGPAGLSWREAWMVLDDAGHEVQVGPCIIWMRARGVGVLAAYRDGETVFLLEVAPTSGASGS